MSEVYLKKVTVRYKEIEALKELNLRVGEGEFVALLGPSGCGKTTCLRTVAGFITPDEGIVYINGERMNEVPPYKRQIGIVFQNYALFPHKNIFENIVFGLRMMKVKSESRKKRVNDILNMLHLSGFEKRYPAQLSGGQQQRVALARALVIKPSVLLLDEPLGAIDKKLREEMQIELRLLQKELGITTLFVTHDQEEALTMADRIVIMDSGKIRQEGKPEVIYNRPKNSFVAEFIGVSNIIKLKIEKSGEKGIVCRFGNKLFNLPRRENYKYENEIQIAIRPEKISTKKEYNSQREYFHTKGVIKNIVFKGSFILYYVEIFGENLFIIQKDPDHNETDLLKVNSEVCLYWNIDDIVILEQ